MALVLCSIGVFGMVSYSVSRSVCDIGIRMALCAAVSGVLASMMFGHGTHDPIVFMCILLFLLAVAFVAAFIPGQRAMRVDPTR